MTTDELQKLTPEEKQTLIAEYLGFSDVSFDWDSSGEMRYREWTAIPKGEIIRVRLPDYLNSLDAMNAAEKTLPYEQQGPYVRALMRITNSASCSHWDCAHATAAQRAYAFLSVQPVTQTP